MPKQGKVEIVAVVDRSGSMEVVIEDAIGSFNTFLDAQKAEPGEADFSLTLFNTSYEIRYSGVPIKNVEKFTKENYRPGGCTALLDAIGKTIDEVGERLSKTDEDARPEKVLFVVLTDGKENSSVEYTRDQVKKRIEHQTEAYKWEFVWLAAGPQAFEEALSTGIRQQNVSHYVAGDGKAHCAALQSLSDNVRRYRRGHDVRDWRS